MSYNPQVPPQDPEELLPFLQDEFFKVAQEMNPRVEGQYEVMYKMPERVKPGTTHYFDGVSADPLGIKKEGWYRYGLDNQWHYMEPVPIDIPEPPKPGPFVPFTPTAPWLNSGSNYYRKNPWSVTLVLTCGLAPQAALDNSLMMTLPAGHRPAVTLTFMPAVESLGSVADLAYLPYIQVFPDGRVVARRVNKNMQGLYLTCDIPLGS